jgi:hypothetical protein
VFIVVLKKKPIGGDIVPLNQRKPGAFDKDTKPDTLPPSERKRISDEMVNVLEKKKDVVGLVEAALRITLDSSGNKKCVNAIARIIEAKEDISDMITGFAGLTKIITEGRKEVALEAVAELERLTESNDKTVSSHAEACVINTKSQVYTNSRVSETQVFGRKIDEDVKSSVKKLYAKVSGIENPFD